jgi:hypothetical protein
LNEITWLKRVHQCCLLIALAGTILNARIQIELVSLPPTTAQLPGSGPSSFIVLFLVWGIAIQSAQQFTDWKAMLQLWPMWIKIYFFCSTFCIGLYLVADFCALVPPYVSSSRARFLEPAEYWILRQNSQLAIFFYHQGFMMLYTSIKKGYVIDERMKATLLMRAARRQRHRDKGNG